MNVGGGAGAGLGIPKRGLRMWQVAVLVILAAKLILIVAVLTAVREFYLYGDGGEYYALAENWVRFGMYSRDPQAAHIEVLRLPGYPAFLTLFQVFDSAHRLLWISSIQVIFTHLWLFAVAGWIARRFGGRVATAFVVLLSLTVSWIHYPATIHSDFLFAISVFSGGVLMIEAMLVDRPAKSLLIGTMLCWAVASLVRPDLLLLPVWLVMSSAASLLINRRGWLGGLSIDVRPQLWAALGCSAAMILWSVRNFLTTGKLTYTTLTDFARLLVETGKGGVDGASGGTTGFSLIDIVFVVVENAQTLAVNLGPTLFHLFINPSRWYLHKYAAALGIEIESAGVPFSKVGFGGLAPAEYLYALVLVSVSLIILGSCCRFIYLLVQGRAGIPTAPALVALWVALYFIVQKGVWGAFDGGSPPRYAMSVLPFLTLFAALALFARTDRPPRA